MRTGGSTVLVAGGPGAAVAAGAAATAGCAAGAAAGCAAGATTGVGAGAGWAVETPLDEVVDSQPVNKKRASVAAKRPTDQCVIRWVFFIFVIGLYVDYLVCHFGFRKIR